MTEALFIYSTASSCEEAERIAEVLVTEELAACVNILPGVLSVYRWKGAVEKAKETSMIIKTTVDAFQSVSERLSALHSYDCPCVIALPIIAGSDDYLNWIKNSVSLKDLAK